MSDPVRWTGQMPPTASGGRQPASGGGDGTNLADILERVLDKGIVIAGDIQINLLDIELLTIKLRLVVASVDRAKEMGIDWWERDPTLSSGHQELTAENDRLRARIEELESGRGGNGHGSAGLRGGNGHVAEDAEDAENEDADIEDGEIDDADVEDAELEDAELEDAELEDADVDVEDGDTEVDEPEPEPVRRRTRKARS